MKIALVAPVYQDWASFRSLLLDIDKAVAGMPISLHAVAIDDASIVADTYSEADWTEIRNISSIEVVRLHSNQGHQRAIAVGLVDVCKRLDPDAVLVMDSDGEDKPEDVSRFIKVSMENPGSIIVGSRTGNIKRPGRSLFFNVSYLLYKICFKILTGYTIDFGNFSLVPKPLLARIVYMPDIWNHLAASLVKSKLPLVRIPVVTGKRYAGQSSSDRVSWLIHGLSAISVFSDRVFVRVLIALVALAIVCVAIASTVVVVKLTVDWAVPTWTTTVVGTMGVIFLQSVMFASGAAFMVFQRRSSDLIVPALVAERYILQRKSVFSK